MTGDRRVVRLLVGLLASVHTRGSEKDRSGGRGLLLEISSFGRCSLLSRMLDDDTGIGKSCKAVDHSVYA